MWQTPAARYAARDNASENCLPACRRTAIFRRFTGEASAATIWRGVLSVPGTRDRAGCRLVRDITAVSCVRAPRVQFRRDYRTGVARRRGGPAHTRASGARARAHTRVSRSSFSRSLSLSLSSHTRHECISRVCTRT